MFDFKSRVDTRMSGLNLQLRKFKPENMPNDATSIFVAKRRSGKSVAVKDIMWHKRNIPCGIVCNGTEEGNSFYGEFIPDLFVYSDFDKDAIERVIQRQRKLVNGVNKDKPVIMHSSCSTTACTTRSSCGTRSCGQSF